MDADDTPVIFMQDYELMRPVLKRLPEALLQKIDWLVRSVTYHPDRWALAWEARMELMEDGAPLVKQEANRRGIWWDSLAAAKKRRRGKEWSALGALFVHAMIPTMPDGTEWSIDAGAAAIDAAGDCLAALVAYDDASSLFEASPDAVRFLLSGGNPVATLMYPAVIVKHSEAV